MLLRRARKDLGQDGPLPSYGTTRRHRWTGAELERAQMHRTALVSGTPDQVAAVLTALAASHGVDELTSNTLTRDPSDRQRSYELLAEAFALPAPHPQPPVRRERPASRRCSADQAGLAGSGGSDWSSGYGLGHGRRRSPMTRGSADEAAHRVRASAQLP
ncbi:hypothetical protein ACIF8W_14225 [Streptomyces sp. NPDC085639]|uniref:hypothetical protein n=1 Tax=Streptomyces sp. NPDC085639 TaxID=3365734 RepID=UPI0037CEBCFF